MNQPNSDIASEGSLAGQFMAAFRNLLLNVEDMLPATVVSYDEHTNRAVIKPLVMMATTEGQTISRAPVHNIPVFRFGGGGFFLRVPIKPGDFGWLKANDRDISLICQRGGQEDQPNTARLHSFSDAMFFPDTASRDRHSLIFIPSDGFRVEFTYLESSITVIWTSNNGRTVSVNSLNGGLSRITVLE